MVTLEYIEDTNRKKHKITWKNMSSDAKLHTEKQMAGKKKCQIISLGLL